MNTEDTIRPGTYFSGIVKQIGAECIRNDINEGDKVVGVLGVFDKCGALAEYVAVPEFRSVTLLFT